MIDYKSIREEILKRLYAATERTLVALVILETLLFFLLFSYAGTILYLWYTVIFFLTLSRFYDGYQYKYFPQKHTSVYWHKLFIFKAWSTALLFALLALYIIPHLNDHSQLIVFTILFGISGGATLSLSADHRTAVGYIAILLLPVAVEMIFLHTETTIIVGFLLILYFITSASLIFHDYNIKLLVEKKNAEIEKVQTELYNKQKILALFFEQAPIGIFTYNTDLIVTDCNQALLTLFNTTKEELIGVSLDQLPDKSPIIPAKKALTEGIQAYVGEYTSRKNVTHWVEGKSAPIYDHHQNVVGGVVLVENKTKEHNALKDLQYYAMHDVLTSLNNRRGFSFFMEELISKETHGEYYSILFYMDLNQFKQINDSLGHSFGDRLLIAVAERLKMLVDDANNLTRMGGDEFVVVVPFVSQSLQQTQQKVEECIKKIQHAFNEPFVIEDIHLHIKTSIGIVIIEPNFNDIEEIVRQADVSMYQAKKHNNDYISYYNQTMDAENKKVFNLRRALVSALQHNELKLYYQPILNIKDNSLRAAEALIRWKDADQRLILPNDFIPIAIEYGHIVEIGWWVIETVCKQIRRWKKEGKWKVKYISINIDAKQLLKNNFVMTLLDIMNTYDVKSSEIKLEITENSLIDNFEITQDVIQELDVNGIKCAIDDFGTGYSSLAYLRKLSFSVLKIDRSFTLDLVEEEESIAFMRTLLSIGKLLHYNIIIEGIEEASQLDILRSMDESISYQGYLASPPLPEDDFREKFLQ